MLVLAVETATARTGVALADETRVLATSTLGRDRRHVEHLVPSIRDVCAAAGVALRDVGAVAVDVGPGLFTGLRVGIATADGLAAALGVPLVPWSSLDLLAFPHRHADRLVAAVVDARRKEVFSSLHRDGEVVRPPIVSTPEALAAELAGRDEPALVVGDGALRYADVLVGQHGVVLGSIAEATPSVEVLAALAVGVATAGGGVPAGRIEPIYLRDADAKANFDTMHGRVTI